MLRKNPGFTAVTVLTLALGIGANSAMFSAVNGILLRSLPFKEPSRLVTVLDTKPSKGVDWLFVSPNRFEEWVRHNTAFDQIAAAESCYFKLGNNGAPILLQGGCATASFFPMLGVSAVLGKTVHTGRRSPWRQHSCHFELRLLEGEVRRRPRRDSARPFDERPTMWNSP